MSLLPTRRRRRRAAEDRTERSHDDAPVAAPARPPIVELRDATVVYHGGHVALERVSFGIERGEFVFVVGPTGCGKSTLIRTLIGEVPASSGQVLIAGHDVDRLPKRRIPHLRRRIGTVFQDFKLLPNRTVYDNVAYTLKVTGAGRGDIRRKVPEILRLVGLQGKVHNYPDQLSGGEQQRVAFARALLYKPAWLFLDEATSNLDDASQTKLYDILMQSLKDTTIVSIAHRVDLAHAHQQRVELRPATGGTHELRIVAAQPA